MLTVIRRVAIAIMLGFSGGSAGVVCVGLGDVEGEGLGVGVGEVVIGVVVSFEGSYCSLLALRVTVTKAPWQPPNV